MQPIDPKGPKVLASDAFKYSESIRKIESLTKHKVSQDRIDKLSYSVSQGKRQRDLLQIFRLNKEKISLENVRELKDTEKLLYHYLSILAILDSRRVEFLTIKEQFGVD